MDDDRQLLTAYVRDGSEEAFSTLASRYLDLVFSAAMRQLGNEEQARDAAQAVFLLLARKAKALAPDIILAGWLYRTARFVAMEAMRSERRRKLREESMANSMQPETESDEIWKAVCPHLDAAMDHLPQSDRTAILLRYFERRPVRELAEILGLSEEAAKKRVSRALEKLRVLLERKGIKSSSTLLGAALLVTGIQPTPAAAAAGVLSGLGTTGASAPAHLLMKGTIQMITHTKIQAAAAAAALLFMASGGGYVGIQHMQALHALSAAPPPAIESSRGAALPEQGGLAEAVQENQQLRQQALELYRLRDAVTQLAGRARPGANMPSGLKLQEAPPEFRPAAERLRELQYQRFMAAGAKAIALQPLPQKERYEYIEEIGFLKKVGLALRVYATEHKDEFPPSLETLAATNLLEDEAKQRLQSGKYEYIRFNDPESKSSLPAVWWSAPDEKGVRLAAVNDGSVQTIREPADVPKPGYLALPASKTSSP